MTDKYAVIGIPIAHSKSPLIHQMFAQQTGQDMSYEAILAPLDGFAATIERLRKEGYKGCNVTVPFKFEAFKLATELSERAQAAQAVNTIVNLTPRFIKRLACFVLEPSNKAAAMLTFKEKSLTSSLMPHQLAYLKC